jgi:hypothetical protein
MRVGSIVLLAIACNLFCLGGAILFLLDRDLPDKRVQEREPAGIDIDIFDGFDASKELSIHANFNGWNRDGTAQLSVTVTRTQNPLIILRSHERVTLFFFRADKSQIVTDEAILILGDDFIQGSVLVVNDFVFCEPPMGAKFVWLGFTGSPNLNELIEIPVKK